MRFTTRIPSSSIPEKPVNLRLRPDAGARLVLAAAGPQSSYLQTYATQYHVKGRNGVPLPEGASASAQAHGTGGAAVSAPRGRGPSPTIGFDEPPHTDGTKIFEVDPMLEGHRDHLQYRWGQYTRVKAAIAEHEGSVERFAEGYKHFGITEEGGEQVYREWAPAAVKAWLIGDFNGWQQSHEMERDAFGVWSVRMPKGTIPHNSRLKIRIQALGGWTVDRLPAWIKFARQEKGEILYNAVHWDPPSHERHVWRHERPPAPPTLRIYEAHVGMSGEEPVFTSYRHFADSVLPRIKALGYNTIQLMAVAEHAYYGSFGYHVTNFFAVSSRSGTPEDLKYLVDTAHGMGIRVLMDVVHAHASKNEADGLAGFDLGQPDHMSYFKTGEAGYHKLWDSRLFNYGNWETMRFLLSNLRFWMDEYKFDGFRFDGVTSMLYHHHGINTGFSGGYHEYFSTATDVDACVYMMLANELVHSILPEATTVAEDVSGMPVLGRPVSEGGMGFDYRLGMAIPDFWIKTLKHVPDEDWSMNNLIGQLCNRRYTEKTVAYAESHDQALVGDKTIAMWLFGPEIYTGMSAIIPPTPVIERGMSLHMMIRMVTMTLGGEAWLGFMGNEFGHPEWIDFPREGNNWSHDYCRRQWSLSDMEHLRYRLLNEFDKAMQFADQQYNFLRDGHQMVSKIDEENKVIVAERGCLLMVYNFHPTKGFEGLKIGVGMAGKWRPLITTEDPKFGGRSRVGVGIDHFTQPEPFDNRPCHMLVAAPPRSATAYVKVPDE